MPVMSLDPEAFGLAMKLVLVALLAAVTYTITTAEAVRLWKWRKEVLAERIEPRIRRTPKEEAVVLKLACATLLVFSVLTVGAATKGIINHVEAAATDTAGRTDDPGTGP